MKAGGRRRKAEGGRQEFRVRFKSVQLLLMVVIVIAALSSLASIAWAVPEIRKIDTQNVIKFEEPAELGQTESEGGSESPGAAASEGRAEEKKAVAEGEADVPGEAGAEVHHPVWMIPGWQTFFAVLAVGYYALMLKFLPKIMAKEEGHH